MRIRSLVLALPLLLVAACGDDPVGPDAVDVVFLGSSFARPATIEGVLRNDASDALYTSTCTVNTDHRQGDAWVAVARLDLIACPTVLEVIGPGDHAAFTAVVDTSMPAGTYRLRFRGYREPGTGGGFDITSRTFTIR